MVAGSEHAHARQNHRQLDAVGGPLFGEASGLEQGAVIAIAHGHHADARTDDRHRVQHQLAAIGQVEQGRNQGFLVAGNAPSRAPDALAGHIGQFVDGTVLQGLRPQVADVLGRTGFKRHVVQAAQHHDGLVQQGLRVLQGPLRLRFQVALLYRDGARPRHVQRESDGQQCRGGGESDGDSDYILARHRSLPPGIANLAKLYLFTLLKGHVSP
ncbi:hypothetical protein D9M68_520210 [compost metagenome]